MNKDLIEQIPKVELHCHLDGSVSMATLTELAEKEHMPLTELNQVVAPPDCTSLLDYLKGFEIILALLQSKENLTVATIDVIEQAAKDHVRYLELRFAPMLHQEQGLTLKEVIEAVTTGVAIGEERFDIKVRVLICGMRNHLPEKNLELIETVANLMTPASPIVGFDFAGDEANYPPETLKELIAVLQERSLSFTLHAGECGCPRNVYESVNLGAKRIGHGVALEQSLEMMAFCQEREVLLEICPTSNLQTKAVASLAEYPLRKFLDAGLLCNISTDNRTVSNTNLVKEYQLMVDYCQLSLAELAKINRDSLEKSFASAALKKELSGLFAEEYREFMYKHK